LRRNLFEYLKRNSISCITATHDSEEALAFSDKVMILKEGKIDAYGSPVEVFNGLSTIYQAGLFGDVNVIPASFLDSKNPSEENIEKVLLPHQLMLSETKTKMEATVKNSYFRGSNYLIMCELMGKTLFFEHSEKLTKDQLINLKIR
jgi:ABC-type Fe3+/spermidine/putrescine transport system ATPase subunit